MPWCLICRAEHAGPEGSACPKCGTGGERGDDRVAESKAAPIERTETPEPSGPGRPAHLAILDAASAPPPAARDGDVAVERPSPKKRLVSSAGPAVPIRKQANDSVPSSWMARLEAARVVTSGPPAEAAAAEPARSPDQPPPLRPRGGSNGASARERKDPTPVGKPAHLLIAQLEAEDASRTTREAERVAALFADDRSDEIARVEIKVKEEPKKKKLPDWVVKVALAVLVLGVAATAIFLARREPGPKAEVDPAIAAAAEKRKLAIASLEEGHHYAIEGRAKADEAIASYSKALSLDPTLASAERGIAIAYASKDDDKSAVEHYKKYLELAPSAADAEDVRKIIEKYEKAQKKTEPEPQPAAEEPKPSPKKKKRR